MNWLTNIISGIKLQPENIPNWMVIIMGIGTVFVGLISIIIICKIMSLFFIKSSAPKNVAAPVVAASVKEDKPIENRQEIIAAVTAVCAEEMGKDISALRVVSFKKL